MDQPPMLSLALAGGGDTLSKTAPHLLPCRIHHDGDIEPSQTYWAPTPQDQDGKRVAYFRGRKLHGKTVRLPSGYRGVVAERSDPVKAADARRPPEEGPGPDVVGVDAEEDAAGSEVGRLVARAGFDEVVVWGHEATADAAGDPYVRGVEEWLAVAEQIHSYEVKAPAS